MDVRELQEQQEERMNEIVGIINPSPHDFSCKHDTNADRNPITYTIKSREGLMLKRYIADHVSKKLCMYILKDHKGSIDDELFDKTLQSIRLYE